jgi:molybdopterin synthase catalytic subunit
MSVVSRLEAESLDPSQELGELTRQASGSGAVVAFVGLARAESKSGEHVDHLMLEHHPTLTRKSLEEIAVACAERFDISHVRVVHRCGKILAGEPIVFAGAASTHRRAAFNAADYLMDRLKTDAVFWKRENGETGSSWIEPTDADFADRDRWG